MYCPRGPERPTSCATLASLSMSTILTVGLVGVSRYKSLQPSAHLLLDLLEIRGVTQPDLDTEGRQEFREEFIRASVAVFDGDYPVARTQESERGCRRWRPSRSRSWWPLGALERADLLLERTNCGVRIARVDVPRLLAKGHCLPGVNVVIAEGHAVDDRNLRRTLKRRSGTARQPKRRPYPCRRRAVSSFQSYPRNLLIGARVPTTV